MEARWRPGGCVFSFPGTTGIAFCVCAAYMLEINLHTQMAVSPDIHLDEYEKSKWEIIEPTSHATVSNGLTGLNHCVQQLRWSDEARWRGMQPPSHDRCQGRSQRRGEV